MAVIGHLVHHRGSSTTIIADLAVVDEAHETDEGENSTTREKNTLMMRMGSIRMPIHAPGEK